MRPRTPSELADLEHLLELVASDARGLIESYGDHATADELLNAVAPLQTLTALLADLKQHAGTSRRKTRPKAKATKK